MSTAWTLYSAGPPVTTIVYVPPLELCTAGSTAGAPGEGDVAVPMTLPLGEINCTVAVMLCVTGVTTTADGLGGVDRQRVAVAVARRHQHVVDRALVDQAAQRQDRREAGQAAGPADVTVKLIDEAAESGIAGQVLEAGPANRLNW